MSCTKLERLRHSCRETEAGLKHEWRHQGHLQVSSQGPLKVEGSQCSGISRVDHGQCGDSRRERLHECQQVEGGAGEQAVGS